MMIEAIQEIERLKSEEARAARKGSLMTQDQVMGIVRQVLQAIGMLATTLGFTALAGEVQGWTPIILAATGPVMQLVGLLWNIKANTKSSIITSATNMPEVDSTKLAAAIADPDLKKVAKEGGAS